jgi:hypothetical protein
VGGLGGAPEGMPAALCSLGPTLTGTVFLGSKLPTNGDPDTAMFNTFLGGALLLPDNESIVASEYGGVLRRLWLNGSSGTFGGQFSKYPFNPSLDGPIASARFSKDVNSLQYHRELNALLVADVGALRAISLDTQPTGTGTLTVGRQVSIVAGSFASTCILGSGPSCIGPEFKFTLARSGARQVTIIASNFFNVVMRLSADFDTLEVLAGLDPPALSESRDGVGTDARFRNIRDVAVRGDEADGTLEIFVVENEFSAGTNTNWVAIRRISNGNVVSTLVSSSTPLPFAPNFADGASPVFSGMIGIRFSADGSRLYTIEKEGNLVRFIDPYTGFSRVLFGNTTKGVADAGPGSPSLSMLSSPTTIVATMESGDDISGLVFSESCQKTTCNLVRRFECLGLPPAYAPPSLTSSPSPTGSPAAASASVLPATASPTGSPAIVSPTGSPATGSPTGSPAPLPQMISNAVAVDIAVVALVPAVVFLISIVVMFIYQDRIKAWVEEQRRRLFRKGLSSRPASAEDVVFKTVNVVSSQKVQKMRTAPFGSSPVAAVSAPPAAAASMSTVEFRAVAQPTAAAPPPPLDYDDPVSLYHS